MFRKSPKGAARQLRNNENLRFSVRELNIAIKARHSEKSLEKSYGTISG